MSLPDKPVLPWVTRSPAKSRGIEAVQRTSLTLEAVGLALGDTLEVKWNIQYTAGDEGDSHPSSEVRWWAAEVVKAALQPDTCSDKDQGAGSCSYEIRYAPCNKGHFSAETSNVAFTSTHTLVDTQTQDELAWRRAGDTWDLPDTDAGSDAEAEEADDAEAEEAEGPTVVTRQELLQYFDANPRAVEEQEAAMLGRLPADKQLEAASAYRSFADGFKAFLQAKFARQADGECHEVTAEDVHEFTAQIKRQRTA